MEDTIEITLPVSGKKVEIRNYTTRLDDEKSEAVMFLGVEAKANLEGEKSFSMPMANAMESEHIYVRRLVTSVDGDICRAPAIKISA